MRFTPAPSGWIQIRPSERGWLELEDPGYSGGSRLRMQGDCTKARPRSLDLSAGQVRELAALLASAAGGATSADPGLQQGDGGAGPGAVHRHRHGVPASSEERLEEE